MNDENLNFTCDATAENTHCKLVTLMKINVLWNSFRSESSGAVVFLATDGISTCKYDNMLIATSGSGRLKVCDRMRTLFLTPTHGRVRHANVAIFNASDESVRKQKGGAKAHAHSDWRRQPPLAYSVGSAFATNPESSAPQLDASLLQTESEPGTAKNKSTEPDEK